MWDFIYQELIFKPQFNIFVFFYKITGENAILSMVIVAVAFNLIAFKWNIQSYLNNQKRLVLSQDLKNIAHVFSEKRKSLTEKLQKLQKDPVKNQAKMLEAQKEIGALALEQNAENGILNKKFNIVGNYQLKLSFLQIWLSIGLYNVFNWMSSGGYIPKLYSFLWGTDTFNIVDGVKINGTWSLGKSLAENGLVWIAILNSFFSFLGFYYITKIALRPKSRELTSFEEKQAKAISLRKKTAGEPEVDPEAIAANMLNFNMYIIPAMTLFFNLSPIVNTGVNIYYLFLSLLFLGRSIIVDWYYRKHGVKFTEDIRDTAPHFDYENALKNLTKK
jgi:hypothetical protein